MNKKSGFTLFELLVSISIIAILTALATISYSSAQKKARDARRVEDMLSIQKAEEQWYMTHNSVYRGGCGSGMQWADASGTIIFVSPTEPKSGWPGYQVANCGGASYCVCATLENSIGNSNDVTCAAWVTVGTGSLYCVTNQQ